MSKRLVSKNINNILREYETTAEIVSTESLEEVAKFRDLQEKLSKILSHQREELCKSMTTNIAEELQIKEELSDLASSITATRQRISNAERECSTARSNLKISNKDLQDAEDAVSRKQRDVERARKTQKTATIWSLIGGGVLLVVTAGAAAPLAAVATGAVQVGFAAKVVCEETGRNAALEEKDSCVKRLSQAETELNNARYEESRQYKEKNRLEEKKYKIAEDLNTIRDNVKEIDRALTNLNLEVSCQERVKINAQNLEKTMSYEAKMKHFANIESIEASYRELERRAFQLAIANTENMKSISNFDSFI